MVSLYGSSARAAPPSVRIPEAWKRLEGDTRPRTVSRPGRSVLASRSSHVPAPIPGVLPVCRPCRLCVPWLLGSQWLGLADLRRRCHTTFSELLSI